jgi:hypothetical protein
VARGVDLNGVMVRHCRELGLEVVEDEAISYMLSLPAVSLGAVTAVHIIEHLPTKGLVALLDESLRVLRAGW